jgi:threonine/homoserine/homoserine lactone efflux protein
MTPIIQGMIIGFALAVPIGPIGILCIKRTLTSGTRGGLVVGLSGATADILYALVAAFGIRLLMEFIDTQQLWMRLIGGLILLGAGFHLLRSRPDAQTTPKWESTETLAFFSTLALALTNPLTLFAFSAAFSAIGIQSLIADTSQVVRLIGGVSLGSFCWFALLTGLSRLFRHPLAAKGVYMINRVAGVLLMLFGVIGIVMALRTL